MDTGDAPVVAVECDRCHRPGWRLEVSPLTGDVCLSGARIGDDITPLALLAGTRPHRYRLNDPEGARPGAFILATDPDRFGSEREKLVCVGRKHPRYERVVTHESAVRAYAAAVAVGLSRIAMRDI